MNKFKILKAIAWVVYVFSFVAQLATIIIFLRNHPLFTVILITFFLGYFLGIYKRMQQKRRKMIVFVPQKTEVVSYLIYILRSGFGLLITYLLCYKNLVLLLLLILFVQCLLTLAGILYKPSELSKESALKLLRKREKKFRARKKQLFYMLSDLAKTAYVAEDTIKAETYATELLNQANLYSKNWNYGNAIHSGNIILGRLELKLGNIEKAKNYLIQAGKTPGSPQLNSFGPNLILAKELLERGEREVILEYLKLCTNFWKDGSKYIESWVLIIKEGKTPDFGANLYYWKR